ncbi:YbaY family lipoprotein [Photobacterium alginatilyticum]|uniref:Lipoprotein-related protein n=1 Tax=Photobacterium alginatilyticum TaxID=1775171 RepID=A0ABW9YJJ0_9GAMM|nr:YbaY family lipoprotein [Photobacterium alginatilyticum]NBI54009.1 lipoprotein-related protein [Photobacterium alginatilyticum]
MKKIFTLLSALIALLVISACTNLIKQDADLGTVDGSLTYKERIALPNNARITVTLSDVSKMDVPAEVISSQAFLSDGKQVPFDFQLNFMKEEIKPNHTYSISARIEVNGKLMFITDTSNPVITDPSLTTKLNLMLVKVQ